MIFKIFKNLNFKADVSIYLYDWINVYEIQSLNLMRFQSVWALHPREHSHYLFSEGAIEGEGSVMGVVSGSGLHLLSDGGVFLKEKVNINIEITSLDAPSHSTHNLKLK